MVQSTLPIYNTVASQSTSLPNFKVVWLQVQPLHNPLLHKLSLEQRKREIASCNVVSSRDVFNLNGCMARYQWVILSFVPFILQTDHKAPQWLNSMNSVHGWLYLKEPSIHLIVRDYNFTMPQSSSLENGVRLLLATWCWSTGGPCRSTAPIRLSEAFVCKVKSTSKSGLWRTMFSPRDCWMFQKAASAFVVHWTWFGHSEPVIPIKTALLATKFGINHW